MKQRKCYHCGKELYVNSGELPVKALGNKVLCSDCLRRFYRQDKPLYRLANIAENAGIPRSTIDCIIADFDDEPEEY